MEEYKDSDLTRVANGVKFDIESVYNDRGGFWITETQDGLIDATHGSPCGRENFKCAFYCEDVLNEQKRLANLTYMLCMAKAEIAYTNDLAYYATYAKTTTEKD